MIADHGREARIGHELFQDLAVLRTFRDQVAHGDNTVAFAELNLVHQRHQFVKTPVNISNYDRAAHPDLRVIVDRSLLHRRRSINIRAIQTVFRDY